MSAEASSLAAAVPGLVRSDPHGPGSSRVRDEGGFRYLDPAGAEISDAVTLDRIRALRIPPAWADVWISPDPLGHIQATGTDSKGRLQYLYHQLWREQRDAQKFGHMLRFASALPGLRTATEQDLRHRGLTRDRVVASVVRLIDLGLFRIGEERYADLDHHYGATTLKKQHVRITRDGVVFDYTAKWGKERTIVIKDDLVRPTIRALTRSDNDFDTLWCYEQDGRGPAATSPPRNSAPGTPQCLWRWRWRTPDPRRRRPAASAPSPPASARSRTGSATPRP
jgi:DNA topoisomerase I